MQFERLIPQFTSMHVVDAQSIRVCDDNTVITYGKRTIAVRRSMELAILI